MVDPPVWRMGQPAESDPACPQQADFEFEILPNRTARFFFKKYFFYTPTC